MVRSGLVVAAVCTVVLLALSGCAPAVHPHHHATHAAGPTASATPTPASTKPALADLVLSPDGLGDVMINEPVPDSTQIFAFDATKCVSAESGIAAGDPDAGAWSATYAPVDPGNPDQPPFMLVDVPHNRVGTVRTIWVWSPGVHTSTGVHVGSSRTELLAAYPHPDAVEHGAISDVYVVDGAIGHLVMEVARTDSGDPGYWPADQVNTVLWMGAIAPGGSAGPIAGSDAGPQTCGPGA